MEARVNGAWIIPCFYTVKYIVTGKNCNGTLQQCHPARTISSGHATGNDREAECDTMSHPIQPRDDCIFPDCIYPGKNDTSMRRLHEKQQHMINSAREISTGRRGFIINTGMATMAAATLGANGTGAAADSGLPPARFTTLRPVAAVGDLQKNCDKLPHPQQYGCCRDTVIASWDNVANI